jgi:hypothetical protein
MPIPQMRRPRYSGDFGYETAPINPDVAAEILDYLFNTQAWKSNPDLLKRKVSGWRQRLFADSTGVLSTGLTDHSRAVPLFAPEPEQPEAMREAQDEEQERFLGGQQGAVCELCGEPMPPGEEMFKIHGYSGPCPTAPVAPATGLPNVSPGALQYLDPDDDPANYWIAEALHLRMSGHGWTRIAGAVQRPRSSVRRVIDQQMRERNLVAPPELGDDS